MDPSAHFLFIYLFISQYIACDFWCEVKCLLEIVWINFKHSHSNIGCQSASILGELNYENQQKMHWIQRNKGVVIEMLEMTKTSRIPQLGNCLWNSPVQSNYKSSNLLLLWNINIPKCTEVLVGEGYNSVWKHKCDLVETIILGI